MLEKTNQDLERSHKAVEDEIQKLTEKYQRSRKQSENARSLSLFLRFKRNPPRNSCLMRCDGMGCADVAVMCCVFAVGAGDVAEAKSVG